MSIFSLTSSLATAAPTAAAEATEKAAELFFKPNNFVSMLKYMGIGMLVIFVIITVIILATALINKIFSAKKKDKQE